MAFAAQPDSLPVVDSRRYLDLEGALFDHAARAVALLTRMLDELPRARAGGTRSGAHELPEDTARDLAHTAAASAGRTRTNLGVGLCTVASATLARNGDAEGHLALRPGRHLREVDLDPRGNVGAAAAPAAPPSPTEQVVAEKGGEQIREAAQVERGRLEAAAAQPRVAEAVVELAPLRVGEDLVGLDDFAKPVVGIRLFGHVRMQLTREASKCALDLVGARRARHAEKLVVVALSRGHGPAQA